MYTLPVRAAPSLAPRSLLGLICSLLTAWILITPGAAHAQGASEDAGAPDRIVILNVPGGGTRLLAKTLIDLPDVELRPQRWLGVQARDRGIDPQGLLNRPADIVELMDQTRTILIISVVLDRENNLYDVRFFSPRTGEIAKDFVVETGPDGLPQMSADAIRTEVDTYLVEARTPAPPVDEPGDEDAAGGDDGPDPNSFREEAIAERERKRADLPSDWLSVSALGRLTKHTLLLGGINGANLNYRSAFYPGYQLIAEVFPFVFTDAEATALGFYLDFMQGFDSVQVTDLEGNPTQLPLTHIQFEGGLSYRIDTPRRSSEQGEFVRVRLRANVRQISYGIDENADLPTLSLTTLVLAGHIIYPMFADGFALQGGFEFIPVGGWGNSSELFGESSYIFGMGTTAGIRYTFSEGLSLDATYDFQLSQARFTGEGEGGYQDALAFDFVQALSVGLTYQY